MVDEERNQREGGCRVEALEEREQGPYIYQPPLDSPLRGCVSVCKFWWPRDHSGSFHGFSAREFSLIPRQGWLRSTSKADTKLQQVQWQMKRER